MSRKWLLFLSCLFMLLTLIAPSRAGLTIRVDESATRILFAGQTRVSLAIENPLNTAVAAQVKIELLDTHGQIRGKAAHAQLLKRGTNVVVIPIEVRLTADGAADTRELLWYRLRYHVEPSAGSQFDQIKGVVSLSGISPDIFAIQVASAQKAQEGAAFRLRVRAAHPLTAQPVASVSIEAEITFSADPDDIVLKRSSQTDANGFATLDFQIPRGLEDSEGDIEVTARRGILIASADSEVNLNRQTQLLVSTDKPLYQPGQTLHVRVLMFDAARRAMANKSVTVKLRDPESTTAFRTELTTSRFGVASADWNIPDNARLGDYLVEVTFEDDQSEDAYSGTSVKVSRYELPNFSVNIKPDRPYYLPGQDAQVEVRADYLFGQPVKRGHVRVVRETERHWNYREQKYETEEGDKYAGEVNADGSFVARIKLADEHENLNGEDYSRYRDLSYAAYFTDATTNRTEQRRFDLRLTKNAIHVYVVNRHLPQAHNFPLEFYVSTSYADGSPALCDVAISQLRNDHPPTEQSLQTIKTNRYGLAKVSRLTLPKPEADEDEISLILRARDSQSAAGQHTETLSFEQDQPVIRVETDKSLYRDGEPIRTQITASEADLTVVVDAVNEDKVVQSQLVRLKNGRGEITIPYRPDFIGPITVAAYVMAPQDNDEVAQGLRTVLYPRDRDLKFKLDLNQVSYRPGEEASATFLTRTANGLAAESALGVVIFDKAVEERARTDREFGGSYGFYAAYAYLSGANDNVAGVSRKDLERLDLTKPLPEGLELVAEVFLTHYIFQPRLFQSRAAQSHGSAVFANFLKGEINVLRDRLEAEYKDKYVYPTDLASLRRFSAVAGINIDEWRDPWEMPYHASFFAESSSDVFVLASAGADKRFDTADDFTVLRINRPYFRFTGEAINRAVTSYHMRTGGFIRDAAALDDELRREGLEIETLRDPWGQPYEISFGVSGTKFQVYARTSGPDRKFTIEDSDDIGLWTASIDYSIDLQTKIDSALTNYFQATSRVPQDEVEFKEALKRSNVNSDELCDPWGRPYYVTFKQNAIYGDRVRIFSYATYGQKPKEKTELTPVTQQMNFIYLRSGGEDGQTGTSDDFNVVTFSRLVAEQAGNEPNPQLETRPVMLPGSTGAITGTVVDANDAVIPNARVTARHLRNTAEFSATTSDDGTYILRNLPAGLYELTVDASAFKRVVITDVPVRSSNITRVNLTLEVAGVSETVTVSAEAEQIVNFSTAQVQSLPINARTALSLVALVPGVAGPQLSTPRLREYFPETLVWQPSLETDRHGRAKLNFKLADNITTWKMSVIGSTKDGQIGTVEKEFKSFQPFFVEHDPPRILTEGDEISLPVVVRNYLDRTQPISLEIKPENWFTLIGPAAKRSEVLAGDASRQTFDFRATASRKGRQTANHGNRR